MLDWLLTPQIKTRVENNNESIAQQTDTTCTVFDLTYLLNYFLTYLLNYLLTFLLIYLITYLLIYLLTYLLNY